MKLLIDAQLPARLAQFLNRAGADAVHTAGLPHGNRSTDSQIAQHADTEDRVVVTKDQDFRDAHLLARSPRKLLVVATGNITNDALLSLFELHLGAIASASTRPTRGRWAASASHRSPVDSLGLIDARSGGVQHPIALLVRTLVVTH